MFTIWLFFSILLTSDFVWEVNSHGMMMEPPNRSSIWRLEEFKVYNATRNDDDNANYCGGFQNQHELNYGQCGICGDPYNQTHPRDNEDGGKYGQGIIVRRYKAGQVIPIQVNITQNHWGYFELRLCAYNDIESHLDQSCYDQNLLEIVDYERPFITKGDKNTKFFIETGHYTVTYQYKVKLPRNVRCNFCVLQWHWKTANRNDVPCEDGTYQYCGPQETFRGCADIAIF